jgi:hypothetical protein
MASIAGFACANAGLSRTNRAHTHAEQVVVAMVRERLTSHELDCVPFGLALPLREAICASRRDPPPTWPKEALVLVGRCVLSPPHQARSRGASP